jgi:hypothetical protein
MFKEPGEAAFAVNSQQTKFVKACILNSSNTQIPQFSSFSLQIQGKYNGKGHNSLISLIAVILFSMKTIKNAGER